MRRRDTRSSLTSQHVRRDGRSLLQDAVSRAWPIILLYHLYAGVAGLIQFTPVGDLLVNLFTPILSATTYPPLTALIVLGDSKYAIEREADGSAPH